VNEQVAMQLPLHETNSRFILASRMSFRTEGYF
jgi:hypothetical protein